MILGARNEGKGREYLLAMTTEEFNKAVAGETIKHPTACRNVSGTWEVKFVPNSPEKHKQIVGAA